MTSTYSILSVILRSEIQEKVSIGIILFDNEKVFFNTSKTKLEAVKELISTDSYKLVKEVIRELEIKSNGTHLDYSYSRGFKIFSREGLDKNFTKGYISYLSKYSNNTIGYTPPKHINLAANEKSFKMLFSKYVNLIEEDNQESKKIKPVEIIRNKYKDKIHKLYDIKKEVSFSQVENLLTPVTIDFSGRNGIDVFAQALDMEQPYNYISNDINAFYQLKSAYSKSNKPMQDFVLSSEPPKDLVKQHDIWQHLRSSGMFNCIDISESEKIIEYAEQNGVKPLSEYNKDSGVLSDQI